MRSMLFAVLMLAAGAAASQTLTFTAETVTGTESVVPKLTWGSTPVAASCTASGDAQWTGAKLASGTVTLSAINASRTYTLTCNWPGDTQAILSWIAPTTNTDGTPLTNLAGFNAYYGTTADLSGADTKSKQFANAGASTGTITALAPGTYFFGVKAYNTLGISSDFSNIGSKVITASANVTRSTAITVNPKPAPATGLTVQ